MERKFRSRDEIVGKQVIDGNGLTIGSIKDIAFDLAGGKMSITVVDTENKEREISSDEVSAVGDVVILKSPQKAAAAAAPVAVAPPAPAPATRPAPPPSPKPTATPGLCPNCGYQNEADSRFCIKCGTRLK